jgi:hypothetical protein
MKKNHVEIKKQEIEITPGPWEIGKAYTTGQDLYIWEDAGENKADYDGLPEEIKLFTIKDDFGKAILNNGARIVVEEVKEINDKWWIDISCGWICGRNRTITYVS